MRSHVSDQEEGTQVGPFHFFGRRHRNGQHPVDITETRAKGTRHFGERIATRRA